MPVREEGREKLCFITPWGQYRYRVAPHGYLTSGDAYTHRFSEITSNIKNKRTIVDDTVLWSDDLAPNFNDMCKMLEVCHTAGLIFNSDKFQFGQDVVEFAGLEITNDGVRPCKKFLDAIRAFPTPTNITEVRSFFGMVNQVNYAFSMSEKMELSRHLLRPSTPFQWSPTLQALFEGPRRP